MPPSLSLGLPRPAVGTAEPREGGEARLGDTSGDDFDTEIRDRLELAGVGILIDGRQQRHLVPVRQVAKCFEHPNQRAAEGREREPRRELENPHDGDSLRLTEDDAPRGLMRCDSVSVRSPPQSRQSHQT